MQCEGKEGSIALCTIGYHMQKDLYLRACMFVHVLCSGVITSIASCIIMHKQHFMHILTIRVTKMIA